MQNRLARKPKADYIPQVSVPVRPMHCLAVTAWFGLAGTLFSALAGCAVTTDGASESQASTPAAMDSVAVLGALDIPGGPSSDALALLGGQTGSESASPCPDPLGPYTADEVTASGISAESIARECSGDILYQARGEVSHLAQLAIEVNSEVTARLWKGASGGQSTSSDAGVCGYYTEFVAHAELTAPEHSQSFALRVHALSATVAVAQGAGLGQPGDDSELRFTLELTAAGCLGWVEALEAEQWTAAAALRTTP